MYLSILREVAGGEFGIDLLPVNEHFKAAVIIRRERKLTNPLFVLRKQLFRQTDGFGFIPSGRAVFDTDFHNVLLAGKVQSSKFQVQSSKFQIESLEA